ncbi:MAG: hypothetical protein UR12_C0038G0010 [candidate division TM6 bacterium GW2011_GWF2_30_66]|nr:MAG: hypothetical protein UR12_C0038G0010 [candidate division TM6 bacterium GW2011_GWF2_30_66]
MEIFTQKTLINAFYFTVFLSILNNIDAMSPKKSAPIDIQRPKSFNFSVEPMNQENSSEEDSEYEDNSEQESDSEIFDFGFPQSGDIENKYQQKKQNPNNKKNNFVFFQDLTDENDELDKKLEPKIQNTCPKNLFDKIDLTEHEIHTLLREKEKIIPNLEESDIKILKKIKTENDLLRLDKIPLKRLLEAVNLTNLIDKFKISEENVINILLATKYLSPREFISHLNSEDLRNKFLENLNTQGLIYLLKKIKTIRPLNPNRLKKYNNEELLKLILKKTSSTKEDPLNLIDIWLLSENGITKNKLLEINQGALGSMLIILKEKKDLKIRKSIHERGLQAERLAQQLNPESLKDDDIATKWKKILKNQILSDSESSDSDKEPEKEDDSEESGCEQPFFNW